MRNEKITPLYERLSRDDELQGESNSIESVFKEESPDTLGSVLLRLMKAEHEKM